MHNNSARAFVRSTIHALFYCEYSGETSRRVIAISCFEQGKINVHLVPHTHDDTGWQVTVDQYFFNEVYYVLDTVRACLIHVLSGLHVDLRHLVLNGACISQVIPRLAEDPNRKFIYVEIGFFSRWWDQQSEKKKELTRSLVKNGQLEFINGGWYSYCLSWWMQALNS